MVRMMFKAMVITTFALLAIGMFISAQPIDDAPAGFDGKTNDSVTQDVMNAAAVQFSQIEAPSPDGLGPLFNAVSCLDCHQNTAVGGASQVLEFRAGHNERSRPEWFEERRHRGDTNGSTGQFVAATAVLADGTPIPNRSLVNQRAICAKAQEHLTDVDNIRASRLSLGLFGDGFVEAVPDKTLLEIAAHNHGEAIQVPVLEANGLTTEVGRFGWKDQHASLLSFAGDAYVNEMGVTNRLFREEVTKVCQPAGVLEPNNLMDDIDQFATFMRALMVAPRGPITENVKQGQLIFEAIGCSGCHVETLMTAPAKTPAIHGGTYVIPDALLGKRIHPYGDYLLHDIGTGDGIVQNGPADTQYKIRTMPLWGLRTRTQLMHDAQSATFREAIERHRNEAEDEAEKFRRLPAAQKALLYQFLGSL